VAKLVHYNVFNFFWFCDSLTVSYLLFSLAFLLLIAGRLILTDHALYFEPLRVVSYDKAIRYDLADDLKQVIKAELTGPWGTRLFDKAVSYKSISL